MFKALTAGTWSRPTDKSAVYVEVAPGDQWGIKVTVIDNYIKVEAVDGSDGFWYKAPKRYCTVVQQPSFLERLAGISLEKKMMAAVEEKRRVAREENERLKGNNQVGRNET